MDRSPYETALYFLVAATSNLNRAREFFGAHYGIPYRDLDWLISELEIKSKALESIKPKEIAGR